MVGDDAESLGESQTLVGSAPGSDQRTVIEASSGMGSLHLRELLAYRDLLYFFIWRDVKVRYKQTALGAAWAVLQPLLLMVVFTIFLGHLAHVSSDGQPYVLFSYSALVPWTLFSSSLAASSQSLVGSANLVSKVYFPRIIAPIAATGSYILDFVISLSLLFVLLPVYGHGVGLRVLWLPMLSFLIVLVSLAVGIWLAALNVKYRDVQYAVPFLIQLWLFLTPVAYPSSIVPARWRLVFGLNPMAGVVEAFRWAILGTQPAPGGMFVVSTLAALVVLVVGGGYFARVNRTFADVI